jgi:hypothetical protein
VPHLSDNLVDSDQAVLFQADYWKEGLIVASQIERVELMLHETNLLVLALPAKVAMTLNSVVHIGPQDCSASRFLEKPAMLPASMEESKLVCQSEENRPKQCSYFQFQLPLQHHLNVRLYHPVLVSQLCSPQHGQYS